MGIPTTFYIHGINRDKERRRGGMRGRERGLRARGREENVGREARKRCERDREQIEREYRGRKGGGDWNSCESGREREEEKRGKSGEKGYKTGRRYV
eukprot:1366433-Amorphochlora_amoeboformis.AAC.1